MVTTRFSGPFNKARNDKWVFGDRASGAYLHRYAWTKIVRHVVVTGRASPDDPALAQYWADRRRRQPTPQLADSWHTALRAQHGACPLRGQQLFMFGVGYELETRSAWQRTAVSVAAGSMLLPFVLGAGLAGLLAGPREGRQLLAFVLFLGVAMSVTASRSWPGSSSTEVVDRLTSVGRQLLLPVFFIVAGLRLDLTGIGAAELGELAAILAVAVGGTAGLRAPTGRRGAGGRLRHHRRQRPLTLRPAPSPTFASVRHLSACRGLVVTCRDALGGPAACVIFAGTSTQPVSPAWF